MCTDRWHIIIQKVIITCISLFTFISSCYVVVFFCFFFLFFLPWLDIFIALLYRLGYNTSSYWTHNNCTGDERWPNDGRVAEREWEKNDGEIQWIEYGTEPKGGWERHSGYHWICVWPIQNAHWNWSTNWRQYYIFSNNILLVSNTTIDKHFSFLLDKPFFLLFNLKWYYIRNNTKMFKNSLRSLYMDHSISLRLLLRLFLFKSMVHCTVEKKEPLTKELCVCAFLVCRANLSSHNSTCIFSVLNVIYQMFVGKLPIAIIRPYEYEWFDGWTSICGWRCNQNAPETINDHFNLNIIWFCIVTSVDCWSKRHFRINNYYFYLYLFFGLVCFQCMCIANNRYDRNQ